MLGHTLLLWQPAISSDTGAKHPRYFFILFIIYFSQCYDEVSQGKGYNFKAIHLSSPLWFPQGALQDQLYTLSNPSGYSQFAQWTLSCRREVCDWGPKVSLSSLAAHSQRETPWSLESVDALSWLFWSGHHLPDFGMVGCFFTPLAVASVEWRWGLSAPSMQTAHRIWFDRP